MSVIFNKLWYCASSTEWARGEKYGWFILQFSNPEKYYTEDVWLRTCVSFDFEFQLDCVRSGLHSGSILEYANRERLKQPMGIFDGVLTKQSPENILPHFGHNCTKEMFGYPTFITVAITDIEFFAESFKYTMELIS